MSIMTTLYDMLRQIQDTFGVRVCVHDMSGITFTSQMLQMPYEWKSHHCSYCLAVKNAMGVNRCLEQKALALRLLRRRGMKPYYGVCRAGVCDYILPVECAGRLQAVVFASGIPREDAALCREKLLGLMRRLEVEDEGVLEQFDSLCGKGMTTRESLRFFAELARDMLLRYAGGYLPQSPGENEPLPVAALVHSRSAMMTAVLAYLDENYASSITLPKLADVFFVSEGHLSRRFHEEVGMSIGQYVRKRRIDVAAGMLAMNNESIARVAEQVGFDDPNYFCRVFRRLMGMTPTDYRKTHQGREQELRRW